MRLAHVVLCVLTVFFLTVSHFAGDAIVFFEVTTRGSEGMIGQDVFAQRLSRDGLRLWNAGETPVPVAHSDAFETNPATCSDGDGGAIVVYQYEATHGERKGDLGLAMQRLDGKGNALWTSVDGVLPLASAPGTETNAVVMSDGVGGAIVVYQWSHAGGDQDILAQRIDGQGKRLWGAGSPVTVASATGVERKPTVVTDGRGGVIVLFERRRGEDIDVMAQRVSATGQVLWNDGARATEVSSTPQIERRPTAVPDGQGGALVAFELEFVEGEYQGDVDIMAQRISGDGRILWDGPREPVVVSSGPGREEKPVAITDGAGGMVVVLENTPVEGEHTGDTDLLAQRLDGTGNMLWNDGTRSSTVSSSTSLERAAALVGTGDGGVIVVFEQEFVTGESAGDVDVFAQRLSASGEMVWNEGKSSIMVLGSKWHEYGPLPLPDGQGGVVVLSAAAAPEGDHVGDIDLRAAHLDGAGVLTWEEGLKSVSVAAGAEIERDPAAVRAGG